MIRTFTGKNSFALQARLQQLVDETLSSVGEFGVERIDASETTVDEVLQAVQSLPFLVSKKLVIIRNIQSNTLLMEHLEELVERTAEQVEVVLVEPALDKRKNGFKYLKKATELVEFLDLNERDLPNWVVEQAEKNEAKISQENARFLVERVGANQQQLANEIEKLSLYSPEITKESIELLTDKSIRSTIFELLDAAFSGDKQKAIRLYREQRRARVEPQYVLAMLAWQLHQLAMAVYVEPKTEAQLIENGISPYGAKKALHLANKTTKLQLKKLVVDLSELDRQIKTAADPDAALELYLASM